MPTLLGPTGADPKNDAWAFLVKRAIRSIARPDVPISLKKSRLFLSDTSFGKPSYSWIEVSGLTVGLAGIAAIFGRFFFLLKSLVEK